MSLFNNPISSEKADRLISYLKLPAGACALDAGCGRGEFLIRVIEATGARGIGVDLAPECISAARKNAEGRVSDELLQFREGDLRQEPLEPDSVDLAICIGSTHVFGAGDLAYPNTIQTLHRVVRPGGLILVGEGYWKRPPAPEYLQLIGEPVGIYRTHAENVSFAEHHGLVPLHANVSNDDEWDDFEWSHRASVERQALLQPDDPATRERMRRSREWRNAYLKWGRSTMGFGFYLFMRAPTRA